jgi:stringent starvation protein B
MEDLNKKKYDFLLYLLEEGDAMVCLDARHEDVDVPASQKNNSSLNLIFNLSFRQPIEITEEGIYSSLAFNGRPYKCSLPFDAVWAIYDPNMKNGQVWEESIPEDMNLADQVMEPKKNPLKSMKPSGKPQPQTAEPKTGAAKAGEPGKPKAGEPKTEGKRDRNHLRVIK